MAERTHRLAVGPQQCVDLNKLELRGIMENITSPWSGLSDAITHAETSQKRCTDACNAVENQQCKATTHPASKAKNKTISCCSSEGASAAQEPSTETTNCTVDAIMTMLFHHLRLHLNSTEVF